MQQLHFRQANVPHNSLNECMHTFHEQQYKWRQMQCTVCSEIWPSRDKSSKQLYECIRCSRDKNVVKKFSTANDMHPGPVPECLQNLTQVEEMLIARVSPIMYIYRKHGGQRGYKGHVLNLTQDIQSLLDKLPQAVSKLPVLILRRSGANDTYSDFTVQRQKVLSALIWLKQNNPYYKTMIIDYDILAELPENSAPDELFVNTTHERPETDPALDNHDIESDDMDTSIELNNAIKTDSESHERPQHNYTSFISVPQQQQTEVEAIRSIVQHENTTLPWPELSKTAVSEFTTEGLATMAFPTLFPFGTGDPTKKQRHYAVSLADAFKHLISFGEIINGKIVWRFASHPRFMYWALSIKQRHQMLTQANVYMKQHPNDATLTLDQLKRMVNRADSEQLMSRFSRYISNVQGTKQYWYQRSLELRALIERKGAPTFFWTVSSADTYWPELHNLMPHDPNPTHGKKIHAVINNPHIVDWYFTQRLTDLIKQWLYKEMDAEWHWYRFEYQSRTHAHGCAKLKSDPGLCQLMKKAAISWKLQKNASINGQLTIAENELIAEGNQAAEIVIKYCDWLTCTFNKDLPSDNWCMPTPQNHPCAKNPLNTQSHEQDYCELVNVVERHTKCSAAYCLRKKIGQNETKCRFEYPCQLQLETELHFEELPNHRIHAKVVTKRNDPLINSHNESLLKYWRANVDVQAIVDIEDCLRYMTCCSHPQLSAVQQDNPTWTPKA